MPYGPQRRHAVSSLTATIQTLALMQNLYSPSTFIFIARVVAQIQITAPSFIHPNRSLLAFSLMLILLNAMAALIHLLDFASGTSNGKSLILDFVGQLNPASLTRVLLLDFSIFALQIVSLVVSFINTHGRSLPKSTSFHIDDLLLPPSDVSSSFHVSSFSKIHDEDDEEDKDDIDLESGVRSRPRRRRKHAVYEQLSDEQDHWLQEEDDHSQLLPSIPSRRPGSPLVFSLPLAHLLRLIILLPAPGYAPRVLGGATPAGTPPLTPAGSEPQALPQRPHASLAAALAVARLGNSMGGEGGGVEGVGNELRNASDRDALERRDEEVDQDDNGMAQSGMIAGNRAARSTGERDRMPGDYWTMGRSS